MTTVDQPEKWDRTLYCGTDHTWALRRLTGETPIVPTAAHAQIRGTGGLWLDLDSDTLTGARITIDAEDGWVTIIIPRTATEGTEWATRTSALWDLVVDSDGSRYRWVYGTVLVSQAVTVEATP